MGRVPGELSRAARIRTRPQNPALVVFMIKGGSLAGSSAKALRLRLGLPSFSGLAGASPPHAPELKWSDWGSATPSSSRREQRVPVHRGSPVAAPEYIHLVEENR